MQEKLEKIFFFLQQNCGNYGLSGKGSDYDFVHIPKPVVAAEILGRDGNGFSDVLCGNGNFCGRNTSGPGFCCKFHDHLISSRYNLV